MASSGLRVYPRGFLGGELKVKIDKVVNGLGQQKRREYVVNSDMSSASIIANGAVDNIYAQYVKNAIRSDAPEFRKQVLITSMEAFGVTNFLAWYISQFQSPSLTDMHVRFLNDTMKFIVTGRRDMCLENWMALLKISTGTKNVTYAEYIRGDSEVFRKYFRLGGDGNVTPYTNNTSVVDVIQEWCSQPGGLEDLIGTTRILFGSV